MRHKPVVCIPRQVQDPIKAEFSTMAGHPAKKIFLHLPDKKICHMANIFDWSNGFSVS
jgi:hypothetical protein